MATPTSRYPAAEGSAGVITTWLPLTTVYPLVPSCKSEFYSPDNLTHIYAYNPNQNALTFPTKCWPFEAALWWNQKTDAAAITSLGPFLCPAAYTVAVTASVNSGSILTGCCPSGYGFSSLLPQPFPGQCTSSFTSGATITYVSSWTPVADGYTTITTVLGSDHVINAVQINGYNFDGNSAEPTSTAFGSRSSSSSESPTSTSASTLRATTAVDLPSASSSSSGLTSGAKIGLAVGISAGVVVIAALVGALFFMRRRKVSGTLPQQRIPSSSSHAKTGQVATPSSPGSSMPHELGSTQVHEMNTISELDGNHGR
ncbi:hypothetical protein NHQ30_000106 [Ciborinia camelliae]|nr:hypothetical protein NHQ30_000106 [Ciborinia camelliae]